MINKVSIVETTVKPIPFKGHPEIHHNEIVETFRREKVSKHAHLEDSTDSSTDEKGSKLNIVV